MSVRKKGIAHEERLKRINVHKMHTVVLLANAKVRNRWINDELLQVSRTRFSSAGCKAHTRPGTTHVPHPDHAAK